jgi:hypothetical protein
MKTLKVWAIVIVMLAVSAPSFGYILVYNAFGRVRSVDSETNTLVGVVIRGYLILDINNADGEVNDLDWICYGKDGDGTKVYTESIPYLELEVDGKYQTIYIDIDDGWFITLVGKITNKNIGLGSKQAIAYTMSGNLIIVDSSVFDAQTLRGGGTMSITLNSTKTQTFNADANDIEDAIGSIETTLEAAGYH